MTDRREKTELETNHPLVAKMVLAVLAPSVCVMLAVVLFPLGLLYAYCDMRVWNWFVAPYFHLAAMSLWPAYGFNLWLGSHRYVRPMYEDDKKPRWALSFCLVLISHLIMLAIGAAVHHWVVR